MADVTKVNTNMTRNMDTALSSGPMEENTSGTGRMASNMEGESTICPMARKK